MLFGVEGLKEFLEELEARSPDLAVARSEIEETQTVSFYPGLGELVSRCLLSFALPCDVMCSSCLYSLALE